MTLFDKKTSDPFASREAEKYSNPVPSREFILDVFQKSDDKSWSVTRVCEYFNITDADQKIAIERRLKAMVRDNQLEYANTRQSRFALPSEIVELTAKIIYDKNSEPWAVSIKSGAKISLPYHCYKDLSYGDEVLVTVPASHLLTSDHKQPMLGKFVKVLSHSKQIIAGRYTDDDFNPFITPFSRDLYQDIYITDMQGLEPRQDQIVIVELLPKYANPNHEFSGKLIQILGDDSTKNIEVETAIWQYKLPNTWNENVNKEVNKISLELTAKEIASRLDLRTLPIITIDGEDSKDFDDAVYAEKLSDGNWKLIVAIADVSHYVKIGTELEKEARERGNSVYFPSKVIPMLPEKLSNNLCSLMPNIDRLTLACTMIINNNGQLLDYRFDNAIIHSAARLTYKKVALILEEDNDALKQQYSHAMPNILALYELYQVLLNERNQRGAIDFDTVETKIIFGQNEKITDIVPVVRNVAHKLIEECMLIANVAAAKFLQQHNVPSLYRNHDKPADAKLPDLKLFLKGIGLMIGVKDKDITPQDYGNLLNKIKQRPDYKIIQTVLLRSLSQAVYGAENIGHFGLAYTEYTHFTSPIRRYPDFIVHLQIKNILASKKPAFSANELAQIAEHCSMTERRADDATRDVVNRLKCVFMQDKIGNEYQGVISSVTKFGCFVMIEDLYIDGLVHVSSLDGYYIHDPVHQKLYCENTGIEYHLGQEVKVKVMAVNPDENKIDFIFTGKSIKVDNKAKDSKIKPKTSKFKNDDKKTTKKAKK